MASDIVPLPRSWHVSGGSENQNLLIGVPCFGLSIGRPNAKRSSSAHRQKLRWGFPARPAQANRKQQFVSALSPLFSPFVYIGESCLER